MNSRENFMLFILDYLDKPDGHTALLEIFNEAVDEWLTENPDKTREEVIARFKFNT